MPDLRDFLNEKSLSAIEKLKDDLPKFNESKNKRFNEIQDIIHKNGVTGILLRSDDNGNLFELIYAGEIYYPSLINNSIYVREKNSGITISVNIFIDKIKRENAVIMENCPDVPEEIERFENNKRGNN